MFVELHIIQNFAPSCLNRDDTNAPKDCTFGGFRRARVSSQCFKRAIRTSQVFNDAVAGQVGHRTKLLTEQIVQRLVAKGRDADEAARVANAGLEAAKYTLDADDDNPRQSKLKVLLFLSPGEIGKYAELIEEHYEALKEVAEATGKKKPNLDKAVTKALRAFGSQTEAADIGLFGRMVAQNTNMNIDGACQVAHALSTHQVQLEQDFYTAVDDLKPDGDDAGAGMMGFIEFNSACFYRYALVDLKQLAKNLDDDAAQAASVAAAFVKAAVAAIPSGKQNSMAAHNPPHFVGLRVRRGGMPMSFANAFEKPIRSDRDKGYCDASVEAMQAYEESLMAMYGDNGLVLSHDVQLGKDGSLVEAFRALQGAIA